MARTGYGGEVQFCRIAGLGEGAGKRKELRERKMEGE